MGADEGVSARNASGVRRLEHRVGELEALLGRKTMEAEILKGAPVRLVRPSGQGIFQLAWGLPMPYAHTLVMMAPEETRVMSVPGTNLTNPPRSTKIK